MLWIGLTGGIASGKSTVAGLFKKSGVPVVDADDLARQAVDPGTEAYQKVLSFFGTGIMNPDQTLNRQELGKRVFARPQDLRQLESFLHPWIQNQVQEFRQRITGQGHVFAIYDVPLLFEKRLHSQFDRVIVVACKPELQIARLKSRSGLSEDEARLRIQNQLSLEEKIKGATDLIWNEGSLPDLDLQVTQLTQKFRNLAIQAVVRSSKT